MPAAEKAPTADFRATLESAGKTATGFAVPPEAVAALSTSKRPPVRVTIRGELDTDKREVELPADLVTALAADPTAQAFFETLSPSPKQWHALSVVCAKTDETRQRRIAKSLEMLREGRKR